MRNQRLVSPKSPRRDKQTRKTSEKRAIMDEVSEKLVGAHQSDSPRDITQQLQGLSLRTSSSESAESCESERTNHQHGYSQIKSENRNYCTRNDENNWPVSQTPRNSTYDNSGTPQYQEPLQQQRSLPTSSASGTTGTSLPPSTSSGTIQIEVRPPPIPTPEPTQDYVLTASLPPHRSTSPTMKLLILDLNGTILYRPRNLEKGQRFRYASSFNGPYPPSPSPRIHILHFQIF